MGAWADKPLVTKVVGWLAIAGVINWVTHAQDATYRPGQIFTVNTTLSSTCAVGAVFIVSSGASPGMYFCTATNTWTLLETGSSGGVPAGSILLIASGSCPTGFTEETGLNGRLPVGTLAANGNIGTTGGSDTLTPAGTNSAPALTMNAYTPAGTNSSGAVSAHSGTAVADHAAHTHTYTDVVNHVHVENMNGATTGGLTGWGVAVDTSTNTPTTTGYSTANPTGGVATGTTAGPSITLTHSVTQPANHTFTQPTFTGTPATLTGSVAAPSFTGNSADNRSAFVRVIYCRKT